MKKLISVMALVLSLCVLAACGSGEVILDDIAQQLQEAGERASGSDAAPQEDVQEPPAEDGWAEPGREDESEPAEEAASETDAEDMISELPVEGPESTDFTALSADQCVTDADGAAGQLPRIVLECPGAVSINEDIEGTFRYLVDADYCTLYYEYFKNGRVLSVLIAQLYDGDASYYTPYNLDLETGERLSGAGLLDLLGADADEVSAAELRVMGDEFEYQFGGMRDGDMGGFYEEQYERTVSPDNADTNRLWLDGMGELKFVAKIFAMAGAEYYEYPMSTGLSF